MSWFPEQRISKSEAWTDGCTHLEVPTETEPEEMTPVEEDIEDLILRVNTGAYGEQRGLTARRGWRNSRRNQDSLADIMDK